MTISIEPIFGLGIVLPERGSRELLRSLHTQLRVAIMDGRLQSGVRLPPSRALALGLGISRNTAVAAYDLLLSEGYVESRQGDGTYVVDVRARSLAKLTASERSVLAERGPEKRLGQLWRQPPLTGDEHPQRALRYDFRLGTADTSMVPYDLWRRLSARAMRTLAKQPIVNAEPHGRQTLREAIAQHVSFTRAVACSANDITVTSGAQQAFDLLARILVTPGKTVVAVENPGYPPIRAAFVAAGAKLVAMPVDDEGMVVEELPKDVNVICVTPSHQYPLGMAMSLRRRARLLAIAKSRRAVVLEDDYDAEFRFSGRPLDALQTLDDSGSVIYIGTFSKSLFSTLRLGFVVAPEWAHAALAAAKQIAAGASPALSQDTLAAFIAEGHLARHVRKMRAVYAARRQTLLEGFESQLVDWLTPVPTHAGLHMAAFMRGRLNARSIAARAADAGIGVYPLSRYYMGKTMRQGLVFGFGAIAERDLAAGLASLRRVLKKAATE
ncbi:MAG: PLP-dependent aminotransferase family protein [Usitatibacteraceae bacterium]